MSERAFRLAIAVFLMLTSVVTVNLMVLQPVRPGLQHTASGLAVGRDGIETSALRPADTSPVLRSNAVEGGVVTVTAPRMAKTLGPLSLADRAETTRAIQRELKARGYEAGGIDGVAGLMTEAAIMAYETDQGLPLTAAPSDELLHALLLGPEAGSSSARGANQQTARAGEVIRTVQQQLQKLGYNPGKADGQLGEATINAIRAFEKQQGLSDSGRISGLLVARLTTLAGRGRVADGPSVR